MTRHERPDSPIDREVDSKFVRSGEIFCIGPNDNNDVSHAEIAEADRVLDGKDSIYDQPDTEADAGLLWVTDRTVYVSHYSMTLDLPRDERARNRTGEILQGMYPEHKIDLEMPPKRPEQGY